MAVGRRNIAWLARYTTPIPPAPIFASSAYCPRRRTRAASVRSPKITCEPNVATAIDTAHQAATFTMAAGEPAVATNAAGTSGVIAAAVPANVRRAVLGTAIARAITVLA